MKILLVDHYDSFTFNLYQLIGSLGAHVDVVSWNAIKTEKLDSLWDAIILSPGPGSPKDYPASLNLVQNFYTKLPILGVCLGHQMIGSTLLGDQAGSRVVHANKVMHGKTSEIFHDGQGLFKGIRNPFVAARYHSLILETVPQDFEKSAWTKEGEIMGIRHKKFPVFGIQFHPESFLTEEGKTILRNFLALI